MLSRQEELKERARVLLEQARRDAALKAGNRQPSGTTTPGRSKQLSDVRNPPPPATTAVVKKSSLFTTCGMIRLGNEMALAAHDIKTQSYLEMAEGRFFVG